MHAANALAQTTTRPLSRVAIAIIDSGTTKSHPDLSKVIDADNGVDVAVTRASESSLVDHIGHGTAMSGIIGEQGTDATFSSRPGVAPFVTLIPFRFINVDANGATQGGSLRNANDALEAVLEKIEVEHVPIRVVLCAWKNEPATALWKRLALRYQKTLIKRLADHDVVVIGAAGNDRSDVSQLDDEEKAFPASFNLPNVMSATASDFNGERALFANYGKKAVHLAAPGVEIVTTGIHSHISVSGTSASAAYVAGAAALILAAHPKLKSAEVIQRIGRHGVRKEHFFRRYPHHDWRPDVQFEGILDLSGMP
jgi:subtilisin family serine protease